MEEFRSLVEEEHYDWAAQYLVMKRASIEPNFHNLYMNLLQSLTSTRLRKSVLRETYRNIKVGGGGGGGGEGGRGNGEEKVRREKEKGREGGRERKEEGGREGKN